MFTSMFFYKLSVYIKVVEILECMIFKLFILQCINNENNSNKKPTGSFQNCIID